MLPEDQFIADTAAHMKQLMIDRTITAAELAVKLSVSEARVSQMLNGTGNLTLRTVAKLYLALGVRPQVVRLPDQATRLAAIRESMAIIRFQAEEAAYLTLKD